MAGQLVSVQIGQRETRDDRQDREDVEPGRKAPGDFGQQEIKHLLRIHREKAEIQNVPILLGLTLKVVGDFFFDVRGIEEVLFLKRFQKPLERGLRDRPAQLSRDRAPQRLDVDRLPGQLHDGGLCRTEPEIACRHRILDDGVGFALVGLCGELELGPKAVEPRHRTFITRLS